MRRTLAAAGAVALFLVGCGTTGPAGGSGAAGNGPVGTGGSAGSSAGGHGGGSGATGNAGTGGASGACAEPASCEGYDDRPDAGLTAMVTCLSPSVVPAGAPASIAIYGHHLAIAAGSPAIVVIDDGVPLNGVPVTACHLDVQVPANQLSTARAASLVVSPGGWTGESAPAALTIQ